jgi:hypothetical protein
MAANTPQPPPFTGFSDLYSQLSGFLDTIKNAQPGKPTTTSPSPQAAKLGLGPSTSTPDLKSARATAYGQAGNGVITYGPTPPLGPPGTPTPSPPIASQTDGAKQVIQKFVATLDTTTIGYLSGIGFTNGSPPKAPPTLTSDQNDVVNDVYSTWDASAGAYMKGDSSTGDSKRSDLQTRLGQYDTAVQTMGKTAVPKPS